VAHSEEALDPIDIGLEIALAADHHPLGLRRPSAVDRLDQVSRAAGAG
jgi:hypothetical protein